MISVLAALICVVALAAVPSSHREPRPAPARNEDLHAWYFWWEMNKDRFLQVRQAVRGGSPELRPSAEQVADQILPALDRALGQTRDRDLVAECIMAMAKAAPFAPESIDLTARFRQRLCDEDQQIRETAALAMGVTRSGDALPDLLALVLDSEDGRELSGGRPVDPRTRVFATYALGLIGAATDRVETDAAILATLQRALRGDESSDLRVAAVNAIGLLRPDPALPAGAGLLGRCFDALQAFWARELSKDEQVAQAHVPNAVAKLGTAVDLAPHGALRDRLETCRRQWLAMVAVEDDARRFEHPAVLWSAVAALGMCTAPDDRDGFAKTAARALQGVVSTSDDPQARCLALMALAEIGGEDARSYLLAALRTESRFHEAQWAALGLGVLAFDARDVTGPDPAIQRALGDALLREPRRPGFQSAVAVALGLAGHLDAATTLRDLLVQMKNQDEQAGHICIGLALMGDRGAVEPIRELLAASTRRPGRLLQAAIALAMLGDHEIVPQLNRMFGESPGNLATDSALMSALTLVGDRRAVEPMLVALGDPERQPLIRAFAAIALGGIAEPTPLPWQAALAAHVAYRAPVPTLFNWANGVLDYL